MKRLFGVHSLDAECAKIPSDFNGEVEIVLVFAFHQYRPKGTPRRGNFYRFGSGSILDVHRSQFSINHPWLKKSHLLLITVLSLPSHNFAVARVSLTGLTTAVSGGFASN